ncbi:MAG: hypothetical protein HY290_04200 [Planctomycetia bacterium]|nr:hypothetical protein [Planctomycetia bacterium]
MMTSSRPRRSLRRLCTTLPAALAVVAFAASPWFSSAARGAGGDAPGDDLNLLLRLLSQDIRVGKFELARPIDPLWLKDIRGLQSSPVAAVAETARAVEESAKMREAALKVLEEANAKNEQLVKENPVDIGEAVMGLLPDGVSEEDIEAALRSHRITPSEAAAYRARRAGENAALMTLGKVALLSYANSYLANDKVRGTRRLAETLEANALAEHLVPALAARAGAKRADPPLKIFAGFAIDRQHEPRLITTVFSTSDEGKTEEAARALNDYIATSPGEERVKEAQSVLKELDTLAAEGARMKDSRGNSARQPGMTKPKSRPGAKPQAQSPPKRS